jgi:hypothetical protein
VEPGADVSARAAAFEVPGMLGQLGEQVAGDDLRVCGPSSRVRLALGQEIVGRDIDGAERQVEVGVHRGACRSATRVSTADLGPAARSSWPTPPNPATTVESTIY